MLEVFTAFDKLERWSCLKPKHCNKCIQLWTNITFWVMWFIHVFLFDITCWCFVILIKINGFIAFFNTCNCHVQTYIMSIITCYTRGGHVRTSIRYTVLKAEDMSGAMYGLKLKGTSTHVCGHFNFYLSFCEHPRRFKFISLFYWGAIAPSILWVNPNFVLTQILNAIDNEWTILNVCVNTNIEVLIARMRWRVWFS